MDAFPQMDYSLLPALRSADIRGEQRRRWVLVHSVWWGEYIRELDVSYGMDYTLTQTEDKYTRDNVI